MDAWLHRFEVHATAMKWPREHWTIYLATLLEGKALNMYRNLSSNKNLDYDTLRNNLLIKYHCTDDGFRTRFRQSKPNYDEPFNAYAIEQRRLLARWLDLADAEDSKEGVMNIILVEQFIKAYLQN